MPTSSSALGLPSSSGSLDPDDWRAVRAEGHRMLDDILNYLEDIRERPVWQPAPDAVRERFRAPLPAEGSDLQDVHQSFMQDILPYAVGNAHPGFMGWVHGGGNVVGMLAEMLAAGLNANLGGRDHMPIEVEKQVLRWVIELFGFPKDASGLFLTGSSMANLIGVLIARTSALGDEVRRRGVARLSSGLVAYTSARAHGCIAQGMDLAGLGRDHLRAIPVDAKGRMNLASLAAAVAIDRAAGLTPFLVVGTAGTVDTGAIDDLHAIARLARRERMHFHVDGAFGAMAMLSPALAGRLRGIEFADSIAFDFHKWLQVPYDAGFIVVRDRELHLRTFATHEGTYLSRGDRGMSAGSPWPCDFGPDLSRGFRALKTWFTIKVHGAQRLGEMIAHTCELAQQLAQRIGESPELELLAPVSLNIVCFRFVGRYGAECKSEILDRLNRDLVVALQESGVVAPSSTVLDGRFAIRIALFNHRTTMQEIDALLGATLALGRSLSASSSAAETAGSTP
ncbi:pyridoxal-dependent decarboxylase [Variovorax sp. Sphag1AA]|uniref:pyridoxal phosphate-dependent decarboxylase family protein n=1 Tax=Variovorax sp. Sphag1AA TaxID=2587027 RepID=UPI0018524F51|nr:pyridoxal-dependent decarboxylase [Variovorax sp. Sphag1AA]MBB3178066.1 glutamate/tyrosine decarboxylase-like PLP-dependent enzyme [Variovorax sp. Sphag1AA]